MTSSEQIPQTSPSLRWRFVAIVTSAMLLLSLAAIGYLSIQLSRTKGDVIEEAGVKSAVTHFATELTTYDHSTVQQDIAEVLALSTGSFQKEYKDVLGGDDFAAALTQAKGRSESEIISVYVTDIAQERAETIVVLDQTVTNQQDAQPKTERRRLEITLVKTAKGWRADRVSVL